MSTSVVRYAPPELPAVASAYAVPAAPLSKSDAAMVPGIAAGVPLKGEPETVTAGVAAANRIDRKLPTADAPGVSATRRMTCRPAASVAVAVTVCHCCHPPVLGTVSDPVTFVPFISRWNVPP
jgi:hypothetical protein